MPARYRVSRRASARPFGRSAHRTKRINLRLMPMRGGYRI